MSQPPSGPPPPPYFPTTLPGYYHGPPHHGPPHPHHGPPHPHHGPPHPHHGPPHPHHGPPHPHHGPPYPHHGPNYPNPDPGSQAPPSNAPYGMPYYLPTMMVPVPLQENQATYITNYIYQGETSEQTPGNEVQVAELSGDFDWVPTTSTLASNLAGRAVVGGHEGWDGSPLWIIRSWHQDELIPGKLSVRHNAASIPWDGKEISVQNIEVLCAKVDSLRWVPASNGSVPPSAIPGGKTASGEQLYIGRARYQLSLTPGKIHPSHNTCYISFAGTEVSVKMYDVLCRLS